MGRWVVVWGCWPAGRGGRGADGGADKQTDPLTPVTAAAFPREKQQIFTLQNRFLLRNLHVLTRGRVRVGLAS